MNGLLSGRYRCLGRIGQGGMSVVDKAVYDPFDREYDPSDDTMPQPGSIVAIKSSDNIDAVSRENKILMTLKRSNARGVPKPYDAFVHNGRYYIVMDFVDGLSMRERINQTRREKRILPERVVANLGIQILDTLTYLHTSVPDLMIVYRDLKPENIMLTSDDRVVLVDFGAARRCGIDKDPRIGTPDYAAPELYSGGFDHRADAYSFGATLFSALTFKRPDYTGNSGAILRLERKVSDQMVQVVDGCMQIDPRKRMTLPSARKLLEQINPCSSSGTSKTYSNVSTNQMPYDVKNGVLGKM